MGSTFSRVVSTLLNVVPALYASMGWYQSSQMVKLSVLTKVISGQSDSMMVSALSRVVPALFRVVSALCGVVSVLSDGGIRPHEGDIRPL